MKKMILAAAMTIGASSATMASADCGDVSITEMDWASSAVVTAVATRLRLFCAKGPVFDGPCTDITG
jgi:glycine betaine/proline transport system substrate-binding protein